jgi:ferredoxin
MICPGSGFLFVLSLVLLSDTLYVILRIASFRQLKKTLEDLAMNKRAKTEIDFKQLGACAGYIVVDPKKCCGCQACMMACSLGHTGSINTKLSSIQVTQNALHPALCRVRFILIRKMEM